MIRMFSYAAGAILTLVLMISLFGTVREAIVSPAEPWRPMQARRAFSVTCGRRTIRLDGFRCSRQPG